MSEKKQLTAKEKNFCRWYARTGNGREAAFCAGYRLHPGRAAMKLYARQDIRAEIEACSRQGGFYREAAAGLRRLAFGSGTDALRLLLEDSTPEWGELDLYNISEIKRPKSGGLEIKFFDRQKALEKLAELTADEEEEAAPFYRTLERSSACVSMALEGEGHVQ